MAISPPQPVGSSKTVTCTDICELAAALAAQALLLCEQANLELAAILLGDALNVLTDDLADACSPYGAPTQQP